MRARCTSMRAPCMHLDCMHADLRAGGPSHLDACNRFSRAKLAPTTRSACNRIGSRSVRMTDPSAGSLGWIPRLDPSAGFLGWTPRLDPSVGSFGWIPRLDPSAGPLIRARQKSPRQIRRGAARPARWDSPPPAAPRSNPLVLGTPSYPPGSSPDPRSNRRQGHIS